ncbi:hypothetical protein [Streptomyces antimicrobicus]|uniref:Secreted protein n=1 Tax=Streptomyces antimicrobicus TaxID=2883108 RepID=A0ABS8BA11_9ACTN|nr:hypothetical protein [Streptomyces antimicrobicus]MCB5181451.1 hypothetical protein [Streptomyces antimicrobicus]
MTCMAAAGAAAPAAASTVPVGVPLDAVESSLGLDAPRVATAVPVPVVGAPQAPTFHTGELLPTPLLPSVPLGAELGATGITSPVPNLLGSKETDGEGALETPATTMRAHGPAAVLGLPLTAPNPANYGLPDLAEPKLGIVTPELTGAPSALLGLR